MEFDSTLSDLDQPPLSTAPDDVEQLGATSAFALSSKVQKPINVFGSEELPNQLIIDMPVDSTSFTSHAPQQVSIMRPTNSHPTNTPETS